MPAWQSGAYRDAEGKLEKPWIWPHWPPTRSSCRWQQYKLLEIVLKIPDGIGEENCMAFNLNKIKSMFGGGAASAPEVVQISIRRVRYRSLKNCAPPAKVGSGSVAALGHLPSRRQMTIFIVSIVWFAWACS